MNLSVKTSLAAQYAQDFIAFLNSAPTPYHAVSSLKKMLVAAGFTELSERTNWGGKVERGHKYFVTRNSSSIIAFAVGAQWVAGNSVAMVGAHTDSPCLKIKPISKRSAEGFIQVGVEMYGGGIWHSWFDSDLSLGGRVMVHENGKYVPKLINIHRPLLKIPTLAIHLDRDVNTKFEFNKETQLLPIAGLTNAVTKTSGCCGGEESKISPEQFQSLSSVIERHNEQLVELIASEAGVEVSQVEDFELLLYDHKPSCIGGLHDEFIFSARLDNLTSCFTATQGLIESSTEESLCEESGIRLISCFDHEEIGSSSAQGADSNFLPNILDRITGLSGISSKDEGSQIHTHILESSSKSFFLSSDVAHGVHPNYANKYESNHKPKLGEGPVIKINANQRYMTNSPGIVLLKECAKKAEVPLQLFVVQNASPCGSTIGPILASKTGIRTLDIGNPILSMHSIRETGSSADIERAVKLFESYYEHFSSIEPTIIVDGE
jgi:aspartyl aminopeptidase